MKKVIIFFMFIANTGTLEASIIIGSGGALQILSGATLSISDTPVTASADTLNNITCPSGFTLRGTICMEDTIRTGQAWYTAGETCLDAVNATLCHAAQLQAACNDGFGDISASTLEWSSSRQDATNSIRVFGSTCSTFSGDGDITTNGFRCCRPGF